jgi:dynein heavy chain
MLLGSMLNAGGGGGGGGSGVAERDRVLTRLAKDIQERIAQPFDARALAAAYPVMYEESMNTVLQQEAIRFNKLIVEIHSSLSELRRALQGLVVMSADLEAAANAMFNNQVPDIWTKKAYPSLKPLASWVEDLVERISFIQKWVDEGVPAAFWISGFYFPQAFITGTLQNYARKSKIPIDTLAFDFHVMKKEAKDIHARPSEGCYIYGLFLEGARWSRKDHELRESNDKELFMQMAPIKLQPVAKRVTPSEGIYTIPCYKTLLRAGMLSTTGHSTNFVLALEIPSSHDESHWIKRGVALFCSLNY